jgi:hypothetical protein
MEVIIVLVGLILLIFVLGMLFRKRGDNAIDTMGAGFKSIFLFKYSFNLLYDTEFFSSFENKFIKLFNSLSLYFSLSKNKLCRTAKLLGFF